MVSGQALADAPIGSGQNLLGLGYAMKNTGRVKRGRRGAENVAATPIIPSKTGKNIADRRIVTAVDPLRCFLSVQDDMRSEMHRKNLLRICVNLSLHRPRIQL